MKLFIFGVLWVGFFLSSLAQAQAVNSVLCDHSLKAATPLAQTALDNMSSLGYIHHALEQVQKEAGSQGLLFCTSSVALNKNIYQYFQYLIQVDAYPQGPSKAYYRFFFLFQNASIQAFHNVGNQPWVGLETLRTNQTLQDMISQAQFHQVTLKTFSRDPLVLAQQSQNFRQDEVDMTSLAAMPLVNLSDKQTFLVTWLTKGSDDPYVGEVMTKGVLITLHQQTVEMAENISPQGDLLIPLENQQEELQGRVGPSSQWTDELLGMAKMPAKKPVVELF